MSGICGWAGSPRQTGHAQSVLMDMTEGLTGGTLLEQHPPIDEAGVIACRQGFVPVRYRRTESLRLALLGHVQWPADGADPAAPKVDALTWLAEAYRRNGSECLGQLRGSFALAVLDSAHRSMLLAIDRLGTRTMCFAQRSGALVFGSTVESVARHPEVGRRLSRQALFNYLYAHVIPSPGTVYEGIEKLQPGECMLFRQGSVERRFYWQMRYEAHQTHPTKALKKRFLGLLREATTRTVNGDTEIGAFLSGGTDSSTIAGLLSETGSRPAQTYSIGFSAEGFDEIDYARITARHFGTESHEYYVDPQDAVDAIPLIAAAYDEPFGNASAVPTYLCAKLARANGVRVMLAGDGGDEIFGGNARYAKQKLFEIYGSVPAGVRRMLIEPMAKLGGDDSRNALMRKLGSYVRQASIPLPDRLETYNFLHRTALADILESDFLAGIDPDQPLGLIREAYHRTRSSSATNRMMHLDLKQTLADNDLRKVTRMCELAGIEARFPLLDEALVEFSGELGPALKVRGLTLRYFFKDALKDFLPHQTIAKTKHGFGMPFGLWLREHKPLGELASDSLAAFGRRGIVRPAYIGQLLREHASSHATYYGVMIWVLMMLEQWLEAKRL